VAGLEYEIWQGHWQKLFEKLDAEGYESLSPDERIWYNVRGVIDSINNGGIISFYYNSGADTLDDTIEDLKKLNASNVVSLLTKVNKLFPDGRPSQDIDERNEVIDSWDGEHEELFETLDEKFSDLEAGLETKLEEVVRRIIQEEKSHS
jgi:hypothetical protein